MANFSNNYYSNYWQPLWMSPGTDHRHSCRNVVSMPVAGVTDVTTDLSTPAAGASATVTETPSYSTT